MRNYDPVIADFDKWSAEDEEQSRREDMEAERRKELIEELISARIDLKGPGYCACPACGAAFTLHENDYLFILKSVQQEVEDYHLACFSCVEDELSIPSTLHLSRQKEGY